MIYRLRKKFIKICMLSFIAVFLILFASIYLITSLQTNALLDDLADIVSEHGGSFPAFDEIDTGEKRPVPPESINQESPFTTRFFTVRYDENGQFLSADTRSIASVTEEQAEEYGESALDKGKENRQPLPPIQRRSNTNP